MATPPPPYTHLHVIQSYVPLSLSSTSPHPPASKSLLLSLREETGPFTTKRPVRMDQNSVQSLEKCIVDPHRKGRQRLPRDQVPKGIPPRGDITASWRS